MAVIAPWLQPPNFMGAAEAGARLGLSRDEMLQQAAQHAAQLDVERQRINAETALRNQTLAQRNQNAQAALALREAAIRQAGILGAGRLSNQQESIDSAAALRKAQEEALQQKGQNLLEDRKNKEFDKEMGWFRKNDADAAKAKALKDRADNTAAAAALRYSQPTAGMRDLIFKNSLGEGGTNFDAGFAALNKYTGQPTATATTPGPSDAGLSLQTPSPAGMGLPDLTGTPAPATSSKSFTDKTGTTYIYTGTADDPTSDKNPDNWRAQ